MKKITLVLLACTFSLNAYSETFQKFKAEDIVKFPQSNVACLTKDALGLFMEYGFKKESTKLNSMVISKSNPDGECIFLSTKDKYKIIHVEYNDTEHADLGVAEIVGVKIKSASHGFWVLTMLAVPAK